jgi:methylase of polypeptide subunit release factors
VFNPPYLPNALIHADKSVDGGPSGIEISIHFIKSAMDKLTKEGRILFLISNLTQTKKLTTFISKNNLSVTRVAQKKLFYERLQIFEISP